MTIFDLDGLIVVDRVGHFPVRLRADRHMRMHYRGISFGVADIADEKPHERRVLVDKEKDELVFSTRFTPEEVLNEIDRLVDGRNAARVKVGTEN